jgi:hypothetical protein
VLLDLFGEKDSERRAVPVGSSSRQLEADVVDVDDDGRFCV